MENIIEINKRITLILIPSELIILSSKAKILHSLAKKKLIISSIGIQLSNNETSSQFLVPKPTVLNVDDVVELAAFKYCIELSIPVKK